MAFLSRSGVLDISFIIIIIIIRRIIDFGVITVHSILPQRDVDVTFVMFCTFEFRVEKTVVETRRSYSVVNVIPTLVV
jgi:hypothetical protein